VTYHAHAAMATVCWAQATFSYTTEEPEGVSFVENDVIRVLQQEDNGWWKGIVSTRREGWKGGRLWYLCRRLFIVSVLFTCV